MLQQAEVRDVLVDHGRVTGVEVRIGGRRGDLLRYHAPWTIGAGGYLCPVARKVVEGIHGQSMHDRAHTCAGWREYWDGVQGCGVEAGDIEIHFVDGVLPGYFWLFPVAGGRVNVGMGMVVDLLDQQKGRKLRAMQRDVIAEHPVFKRRFEGASLVEGSGRGWQLPSEVLEGGRRISRGSCMLLEPSSSVMRHRSWIRSAARGSGMHWSQRRLRPAT